MPNTCSTWEHRGYIPSPYLSTSGDTPQVLISGPQYILPVVGTAGLFENQPQVLPGQFFDHVNKMLGEGLPLLGVGRSDVLGDCNHALNALGEGGQLHAGVLGSYSGAVVSGDFSLNPASLVSPAAVCIDYTVRILSGFS